MVSVEPVTSRLSKLGYVLGWSIFVIGTAYWFEHLTANNTPRWFSLLVIAPIFEELLKFLAYRGLGGKNTIAIPIACIVFEIIIYGISGNASVDPMVFLYQLVYGIGTLKHISFWAPVRLSGFRLWSLPIAVLFHIFWNAYVFLDVGPDLIFAGLLSLSGIFFALTLLKIRS